MKRTWWVLGVLLTLLVGYPAVGIALYDFEQPQYETVSEWRENEQTTLGHVHWTQVERKEFICYWYRDWVWDYCPSSLKNSLALHEIFWPVQRIGCFLTGDGTLVELRYDLTDSPLGNCIVINDVRVVQR